MAVWLPSDENILKDQLKERARITDKVLSVKKVRKLHQLKGENTHTGGPNTWRDASDGGWFSYPESRSGSTDGIGF